MPKTFLILAVSLFTTSAFAANRPSTLARTDCGIVLSSDPLFALIEGSVLDQPRVQDLALMRAGPLPSPILISGEMGSGKTRLLKALAEKAAAANIPTFSFTDEKMTAKVGGVVTHRQVPPMSTLDLIPKGSLVILDFNPGYFLIANSRRNPSFDRRNVHYPRLKQMLGFMQNLKAKGEVTAILTIPTDLLNVLSEDMVGRSVLDRFDIVRMEYGRSPQPTR